MKISLDDMPMNPALGETLPAAAPNPDFVAALHRRRSTPADFMQDPGPDAPTLKSILTIASRVPDHRRVTPFRFIVIEGEGRSRVGEVLKTTFVKREKEVNEKRIAYEAARFERAPVVVAVVSTVDEFHRTPAWEQILTAGAVCQNMLLAASAHGFAAQWITEWYAYDNDVLKALFLAKHERIAGFIYIGTAAEDPKERARPDLSAIVSRF